MKITDLLDVRSIALNSKAADKTDVLNKMVDLMVKSGKINNREKYLKGVFAREEESTTGVGEGIAIPHCKSDAVDRPGLAAMVVPDGVDFDSLDGEPVNLIFLIAAPNTEDNVHLDVLGKLSMLLMNEEFTKELKNAETVEEFLKVIDYAESRRDEEKAEKESKTQISPAKRIKILAVTGCPTGIAHTYMAQEALEKQAAAMGVDIKVETRGSGGAKNVLTDEEIAEADGIIVAADTKVPMDRFAGKLLIETSVSEGIGKPEKLINRIIDKDASVYKASGKEEKASSSKEKSSVGHQLYKHLMNGVSHMLPFVVGGGILIAIAFLLDDYTINPAGFGTNTPVAAWFKTIGGYAFSFMLPVLAGYIAMSIADRPGLVVGFVGGYIATVGSTFADPMAKATVPSGFLGALLAGFAAGYIVLALEKICDKLPKALDGIKPVLIYPLAGTLLIGVLMCAVDPAMGMLNTGMTNLLNSMGSSSKILLGCVVGAMMSIDMGGPFNKAAYVFGTGMLAQQSEGGFMIMAAVMIGGMIPPFAIAIATLLFKNKFTADERKSGPVNFIMGLCFISEGAIPYAAADPIRVIPSCMAGSAVAGGLSMAFGCTLRAPHGGIFVFPTIGNVAGYIAAFLIGSVVSAVLLGILKKKVIK
ncbi:MAG: fructose-specific PTS transporter subunit EIIC [Eubacteriales bacterium]|nr:fructose-specific PTS transporter subunit EIIC [Eubacteriales bacterium]